jgi:hypothetical protein
MSWLHAGVPISLLADLAARGGPVSAEILAAEALEGDVRAALGPARTRSRGDGTDGFTEAAGS